MIYLQNIKFNMLLLNYKWDNIQQLKYNMELLQLFHKILSILYNMEK